MKKLFIPFIFLILTCCSKEIIKFHGHRYKVIEAGDQYWMADNLQSSRYRGGKKIPIVQSYTLWPEMNSKGCGYLNNDTSKLRKYGMVYNWKAVDCGRLCPRSWRVPTNDDWTTLQEFLGGSDRAGGKMKSVKGWKGKHVSGDDIGFNATPGGYRLNGDFQEGEAVVWWSSSIAKVNDLEDKQTGESFSTNDPFMKWIWGRRLETGSSELMNTINRPNNGFYIRCVKNIKSNK